MVLERCFEQRILDGLQRKAQAYPNLDAFQFFKTSRHVVMDLRFSIPVSRVRVRDMRGHFQRLYYIVCFLLLSCVTVFSFLDMVSKAWLGFFFVAVIVLLYYSFHSMKSAVFHEPMCKRSIERNGFPGDWSSVKRIHNQLKLNLDWKKIPRKSAPPLEELHDKWIVLTTVSSPTEDVKRLAKIDGWKVVVVGDTKTPADWR